MTLHFNGGFTIGSLMLSINGLIVFNLIDNGCQHWSCWIEKVMELKVDMPWNMIPQNFEHKIWNFTILNYEVASKKECELS
jgi:hypothetical protein